MADHRTWITVYGFDLELASDVFTLFEGFGDILDHRIGDASNSMDLLFSTHESMEYALAQDGLRINVGPDQACCIMIGVKYADSDSYTSMSATSAMSSYDTPGALVRKRRSASGARDAYERRVLQGAANPDVTLGRTPQLHHGAPPEHNTQSKHGRSLFMSTADRRYAAYATSGYGREPRKDLSCCQMAMRYLYPQNW